MVCLYSVAEVIVCFDESSSVVHYTDPNTLETHTTSTKGSVFVLHFELPPSYTCHKDELYGLWQNGELDWLAFQVRVGLASC